MKKLICSFVYMALGMMALTSCVDNDDDLGDIQVPDVDYVLPQGKNAEADQTIVSLFQKYHSYFLYDFTETDFQWSQVNTNTVGDAAYRYDPIAPEKVSKLLEAIQKGWLDFYTDDFLKKALPYRVLLAENVQIQERTFDWDTWDYVLAWVNKPSRHIANQMAIGNIEEAWAQMSASEKRAFKSYVQTDFLLLCIEQGIVSIPASFYAVSDYQVKLGWNSTTEKARDAGFVYDPQAKLEWSIDGNITKSADINAFVASLVYRTDKEWEGDLAYDFVKRKYDILVSAFESAGIDIKRIGNATFEE